MDTPGDQGSLLQLVPDREPLPFGAETAGGPRVSCKTSSSTHGHPCSKGTAFTLCDTGSNPATPPHKPAGGLVAAPWSLPALGPGGIRGRREISGS